MSQPKKERKVLLVLLMLAALVIWGQFAYQLFVGVQPDEEPAAIVRTQASENAPRLDPPMPATPYQPTFRDPFQQQLTEPRPPPRRVGASATASPPERTPPPLRLVGVVDDTAMLQDAAGALHFAKRGEDVAESRVVNIQRTEVQLRYQGRMFTIRVE